MRIAVPLSLTGAFALHFGAASRFQIFDVDPRRRAVRRRLIVTPQASRPCQWPRLLRAAGVDLLLARRIGQRALRHLAGHTINVLTGVPAQSAEQLVAAWLQEELHGGKPACDRTGPYLSASRPNFRLASPHHDRRASSH